MSEPIKLTQYAHAAGCGCKMAPADLEKILSENNSQAFAELMVGNHTNDDAAVWDLGNGTAIINTVDFFMPIVDDAFDFGRIAAANAISDVYAMGGKPLFANALLGWPIGTLPLELAAEVMRGAKQICENAGIPIAGGHSIDCKEPLFGLTVTGAVAIQYLKRNNTAKVGDVLLLTKHLGTGVMGTAIKRGLADPIHAQTVIDSMCLLNTIGSDLGHVDGVNALTDVTGFGLLGHLIEICKGANLTAELDIKKVPYFPFLQSYLDQNIIPDNTYRNWNAYEKLCSGISDMFSFQLLNDPQTSGGLLIAVAPSALKEVQALLVANGLEAFVEPIAVLKSKTDFFVEVVSGK